MEADMAHHHSTHAHSTKQRLVGLDAEFERCLDVPVAYDEVSTWIETAALPHIAQAISNAQRVGDALRLEQRNRQAQVNTAMSVLAKLTNYVDLPEEDDEGVDEAALSRAYAFDMLRQTKQEMEIDFAFMVRSLLSANATADWCDANPFLERQVQQELMKLVSTMLLHTSTILHISALAMPPP
jgi:hypothetical protein